MRLLFYLQPRPMHISKPVSHCEHRFQPGQSFVSLMHRKWQGKSASADVGTTVNGQ